MYLFGAGKGTRTPGLLLGKQMLYQLSYTRNIWCSLSGSNRPSPPYQGGASPSRPKERLPIQSLNEGHNRVPVVDKLASLTSGLVHLFVHLSDDVGHQTRHPDAALI